MKHLPQPAYMEQSLDELRLGTYTNIATVSIGVTQAKRVRVTVTMPMV